ncbi:MAG: hypothetical protein WCF44_21450 [Candidatus Methylophosphatis roskildensis]
MQTAKLFLASSNELKEDRNDFEIFLARKNEEWRDKGVAISLVHWEDFFDAVSRTRLQDEYNKAIRGCELFVMLFWTKVGPYTSEEFDTALDQFKNTGKPLIYTYFKAAPDIDGSNEDELMTLLAFKKRLKELKHFVTVYQNIDALKFHFNGQLEKLLADGSFGAAPGATNGEPAPAYQASVSGNGAIAQGNGAIVVGAGGVQIGGNNTGSINTGTQIDTGGGSYVGGNVTAGGDFVGRDRVVHGDQISTGDISGTGHAIGRGAQASVSQGISPRELEPLFAALLAVVAQNAPAGRQDAALRQVQELKAEAAKGKQAEDGKLGRLIEGLVDLVPAAVGTVVSTFATPILGGIAGPLTKHVLDKLKTD